MTITSPEANEVINLIKAIGEVTLSDDCKARIDTARKAYDKLALQQQELVTNYMTLTSAEDLYANLATYTVTIPADVSFNTENFTATANVTATYNIGSAKTLTVTVESANDYHLKADYDNTLLIPYTLTCGGTTMNSTNTIVLTATGTAEESKMLDFAVDSDKLYAGAYSDTLTFTISLS